MKSAKGRLRGFVETSLATIAAESGLSGMGAKPPLERLERIRLQLIDRLVLAAALVAIAYLPMLVWQVYEVGWYPLLWINGGFLVFALCGAALHKQLSAEVKSFLLVAAVAVLGLAGVYHLGMIGAGYWWCLQASVFAVALYSLRVALGVAAVCVAAMAAIAVGFVTGGLQMPANAAGYLESPSAWGGFLIVVVFAPLLLMAVFSSYQKTIARLIDELNGQRGELARRVDHDPLTGLPQSSVAADRLRVALQRSRRNATQVALLFVDLDGFKSINDGHGHAAGDYLLQRLAERLRNSMRAQDFIARVGGDEFIVILTDVASEGAAGRIAQLIIGETARAVAWQDQPLQVGASIGVALYPAHGSDPTTLRKAADAAMYRAKRLGKNRWVLAEPKAPEAP